MFLVWADLSTGSDGELAVTFVVVNGTEEFLFGAFGLYSRFPF